MKDLKDVVPIQLTNSPDKYNWLNGIYKSAATDDGRAIVAAIAILIHEVIQLQTSITDLQDHN